MELLQPHQSIITASSLVRRCFTDHSQPTRNQKANSKQTFEAFSLKRTIASQ
jgi:hypothetical protein